MWLLTAFLLIFSLGSMAIEIDTVLLDLGDNIGYHVQQNMRHRLAAAGVDVASFSSIGDDYVFPDNCVILSLGNATLTPSYITNHDLHALPAESYVIEIASYNDVPLVVGTGQPLIAHHVTSATNVNYGAILAAYAVLELLGFAFLHPLQPYIPSKLTLNTSFTRITSSPHWPERNFHIHTQHPLELNEVLQGMDIPMFGPLKPNCGELHYLNNTHDYCELWEDMVKDVDRLFEWAVANKLNRIEWLLLGNYKWKKFDSSELRQRRLRALTSLGHEYGLLIGADVPLGNIQQHAWYMVNPRLPLHKQIAQIHKRVDWIVHAGFDFVTTESGLSEFTHPDCSLMLELLNEFAMYVNITWKRDAAVKVHCSRRQSCDDFLDPRTQEPINFNFLPYHAHPSLGILPHTVQVYGLDDPTGNTYGNENFKDIEEYMFFEAKNRNRSVVYYGETAYWVNVDIDVPLFLPLYGQRRLHDLRHIAQREKLTNTRIQGQMNFDSGWEWTYWLNDVITARASWNPLETVDEWDAYRIALQPAMRIFGPLEQRMSDWIIALTKIQLDLLVYGIVDGEPCNNTAKLSGIAYLSGTDTWVELPRMFGLEFTQPDKVRMEEIDDPNYPMVFPLLYAMERSFGLFADEISVILDDASTMDVDAASIPYLHEFNDTMYMLYLRAKHVRLLYESKAPTTGPPVRSQLQTYARSILMEAAKIVSRREAAYRVPWQRIGGWRENPTVYRFTYLWAVHSLYYWWRDQGLAEEGSVQSQMSPCYLNRMDASEVAAGWGKYTLEVMRYLINNYSPFSQGYPLEIVNCIAPPSKEYVFPQDLYHHY